MSFATETKNELSRVVNEKKCCTLAEISGFIRIAGSLGMTFLPGGSKFTLSITTDKNLSVPFACQRRKSV